MAARLSRDGRASTRRRSRTGRLVVARRVGPTFPAARWLARCLRALRGFVNSPRDSPRGKQECGPPETGGKRGRNAAETKAGTPVPRVGCPLQAARRVIGLLHVQISPTGERSAPFWLKMGKIVARPSALARNDFAQLDGREGGADFVPRRTIRTYEAPVQRLAVNRRGRC